MKKVKVVKVTNGNWRAARAVAEQMLVKYLKEGYRTANDVADYMRCSFMVARRRIYNLEEGKGWLFEYKDVRQGIRGPTSTAYFISGPAKHSVAAKIARSRR